MYGESNERQLCSEIGPEVMEEDISSGYQDDTSSPLAGRVDIAQFVLEVERFNCMVEPFAFVLYLWDDLRRWRYPILTVILWVLCNLSCLILTQAAVFTLMSLLVIVIALVCLIQLHTRILDKFLPNTSNNNNTWQDEPVDEHTALQTVRDFKFSLMQMHDFVIKSNEYFAYFYALLKWDHTAPSLKFHVEVCVLLLSLVVLPTRWTAIILTNWFFFATDDAYTGAKKRIKKFIEFCQGKRTLISVFEKTSTESKNGTVPKDNMPHQTLEDPDSLGLTDSDKLNDNAHEDEEEDEEEEEDGSGDRTSQGDTKPGMVARLMELKRRRKIIANEKCAACSTSFSSILKKICLCQQCGKHFCSKCCNQKVPKSWMGATAPGAQTEMVLVCLACHKILIEDREKKLETKEKAG